MYVCTKCIWLLRILGLLLNDGLCVLRMYFYVLQPSLLDKKVEVHSTVSTDGFNTKSTILSNNTSPDQAYVSMSMRTLEKVVESWLISCFYQKTRLPRLNISIVIGTAGLIWWKQLWIQYDPHPQNLPAFIPYNFSNTWTCSTALLWKQLPSRQKVMTHVIHQTMHLSPAHNRIW